MRVKPLFSSVAGNSFRACSPSFVISQISRDPNRPGPAVNAIFEPSGDTDHAVASSRILFGARPNRETTQMLVLPPGTAAFAKKLVLSGSQEAIDHAAFAFNDSGCEMVCISPLAINCTCTPNRST